MELRGITWDHARGYNPLISATETFQACHQGVTVRWERRSLKDFGDYPVSRLAENYDLIIVDHPFIPEAGEKKLLLNLNGYFSPALIQELQTQSVGRSFESYYARDALLAVPVDAACEVAAVNAPFFARCGYSAPETLEELFALKEQLAPEFQVGFPFWPTDLLCVFLNLAAQKAGMRYFDLRCGMEKTAGEAAAAMLGKLAEIAQPERL